LSTPSDRKPRDRPSALLAIAVFKLLKAILLVSVGAGALSLRHDPDTLSTLEQLTRQLRMDPDNQLIHRAITAISSLDRRRLEELGVGTFVYATVFLIEGGGLLLHKRWAEYLTTLVTASFVPFELYELGHRPSVLKAAGVAVNLSIVAYLAARLWRERDGLRRLVG
jgi:uncharacterized membrane protein (DUF2068 family)